MVVVSCGIQGLKVKVFTPSCSTAVNPLSPSRQPPCDGDKGEDLVARMLYEYATKRHIDQAPVKNSFHPPKPTRFHAGEGRLNEEEDEP